VKKDLIDLDETESTIRRQPGEKIGWHLPVQELIQAYPQIDILYYIRYGLCTSYEMIEEST
jgi:hypothetical protein